MDYQLPMFQYGHCCACDKWKSNVRNFITLNRRAPQPGTGWGCVVCRLPMDGALAVVCDECAQLGAEVKWVISGPAWNGGRVPLDQARGRIEHDVHYHPEIAAERGRLN